MDQVAWAHANVNVGGETKGFRRGELLPEPASDAETAERNLLRIGGAIRAVEVVFTEAELADQARQRAEATAAREAALDPGGEPGAPTLAGPEGPVVLAPEDQAPKRGAGGKFARGGVVESGESVKGGGPAKG